MKTVQQRKPTVLCLSGHDPSGGAGIQADIEAIKAQNVHAMSVITCLTRQDTQNVYEIEPVDTSFIMRQVETLLADMPVDAIKIGLIGSLQNVSAIQQILQRHPEILVILDPVLAAGGGQDLSGKDIAEAITNELLPHVLLITPNIPEALTLGGSNNITDCVKLFQQMGCDYSLITGTHSDDIQVHNQLYQGNTLLSTGSWPRLPDSYHGSGCTLASSIAAFIAKGDSVREAVDKAQSYTWHSLKNATAQGHHQFIPNR
jgi:hydroxymethylpyrimidine/phosphomethylpyrimidine kinase